MKIFKPVPKFDFLAWAMLMGKTDFGIGRKRNCFAWKRADEEEYTKNVQRNKRNVPEEEEYTSYIMQGYAELAFNVTVLS